MNRITTLTAVAAIAVMFNAQPAFAVQTELDSSAAQQVTVIKYDVDGAAELAPQVDEAVAIWNARLKNVRFEKGSGGISASTSDRGPAPGVASCLRCTAGTVELFRNNIKETNSGTLRVIVHEFGHILGLDHPRVLFVESEVMSGGAFTNAIPSGTEISSADGMWTDGGGNGGGLTSVSTELGHDHEVGIFDGYPVR